jgi:Zn-dependent alcohol dehydrogenase
MRAAAAAPGAGEALVKVAAADVCRTDAIARDGDMPFPAPGVLGQEGAGIIVAVASGVTNVSVGDKVVIGWPWCGTCRNCLEGQPRYCLWGKKVIGALGGEGRSASLINALITLNKQGRFPFHRLIETFPLERVNDAFEASHAGDVIKPVLRMPE